MKNKILLLTTLFLLISCTRSISFDSSSTEKGLILYPGGLVKADKYNTLAETISKELSIDVFIVRMPFQLALFGKNRAEKIIKKNENIDEWYIAGHSLGGVMAASFTEENRDKLEGLILLASYPMESKSLDGSDIPVLSIYGSNDGLTTLDDIEKSKLLLPANSVFYRIEGANHTQFYSSDTLQKNDLEAGISESDQIRLIVKAIDEFIQ